MLAALLVFVVAATFTVVFTIFALLERRQVERARFTGAEPGWPAVARRVYLYDQDLPVPPPPRPQMTGPTVDMDRFRGKDMTVWGYDE